MPFFQFLAILRARWWVAVLVLAVTTGTGVVTSLLMPKIYTASATVVVDNKPDPLAAIMNGGLPSPAHIATQVEVIQSERVAKRVVRNLKLAEDIQTQAQWRKATLGRGSTEDWIAASLPKSLEVKPSREASIITVSFKAPDSQRAADVANAFVIAYLETDLELRVVPAKQHSSFFDSRAKQAREDLERAQSKLSNYQKEKGIVATDERLDVESARLNELSSQLVMAQTLSAESGSRQVQAEGASSDRIQEVLNSGLIATLKGDLSRNESRLQELTARLGDNHPQVLEVRASISGLRSKIEAETGRVTGGVGVAATINRQRVAEIRGALEAQRAKVLRMKGLRDESTVLVREVESAQRAYEGIVTRLNQSTLESQATQSTTSILTAAVPPLDPSSPKVVRNSILAFVFGALLGIAATVLLELLDRRVRTKDDVSQAMGGLNVLAVMPKPDRGAGGARVGRPFIRRRTMARLAAPSREA